MKKIYNALNKFASLFDPIFRKIDGEERTAKMRLAEKLVTILAAFTTIALFILAWVSNNHLH